MAAIVKEASQYVFDLLQQKLSKEYLYHDFGHATVVTQNALEIGEHSNLSEEEMEVLQLAAWFHDTGHIHDYQSHEQESVKIATEFLKSINYSEKKIKEVNRLILSTEKNKKPEDLLESILCDADLLNIGKREFFKTGKALRTEWELICGRKYSNEQWYQMQYDFLINTNFHTDYALRTYGAQRAENIARQKTIMEGGNSNL